MEYPMLEFKEDIKEEIKRVTDVPKEVLKIEKPPSDRGDFAFPCFPLAPILEKDPKSIAEEIASEIKLEKGAVKQSGPYLNFTIDIDHLAENTILACMEMKDDYGSFKPKKERMIIEHTSANPTGPLHVGRARNPILGDTLARIYEKIGYDVIREYFVNDIGRQMAILTWGVKNLREEELPRTQREKEDHELVRYYQEANRILEEEERVEEEIQDMIKDMEEGDEEIFNYLKENSKIALLGIIQSLNRLNIYFNNFVHESSLISDGSVAETINKLSNLDETDLEKGALFFRLDGDKIFLTREDGTNLYTARDIAYHLNKTERAEKLIDVLGEDHKSHGKFIENTLISMGIQAPEIVFYSFVTFEGGEMSTRKGIYVTLDDFIDTAEEKARDEILKRRDDLSEEVVDEISKKVGISAVRYNIIKVQPNKPIDFIWDEALNFRGNSAPFIQYSYARAHGILEKSEMTKTFDNLDIELEKGEISLLKKIAELPLTLKNAAQDNAPHKMARYAYELASEFNQFYRDYPVLEAENKRDLRLLIVKSFVFAMGSVLDSLGMEKTKKM